MLSTNSGACSKKAVSEQVEGGAVAFVLVVVVNCGLPLLNLLGLSELSGEAQKL